MLSLVLVVQSLRGSVGISFSYCPRPDYWLLPQRISCPLNSAFSNFVGTLDWCTSTLKSYQLSNLGVSKFRPTLRREPITKESPLHSSASLGHSVTWFRLVVASVHIHAWICVWLQGWYQHLPPQPKSTVVNSTPPARLSAIALGMFSSAHMPHTCFPASKFQKREKPTRGPQPN